MERQALDESPLPSGPSLLLHFVSGKHCTGGASVLPWLGCGGGGGRFVEGPCPPHDRLLMDVQSGLDPPIAPKCLHPVVDQTGGSRVETPNFGVLKPHFLQIAVMGLPDSREDPILDLLRDLVSHNGLEL